MSQQPNQPQQQQDYFWYIIGAIIVGAIGFAIWFKNAPVGMQYPYQAYQELEAEIKGRK